MTSPCQRQDRKGRGTRPASYWAVGPALARHDWYAVCCNPQRMATNSLVFDDLGGGVLLRYHSRRALRAGVALAIGLAGTFWQGVAHAETDVKAPATTDESKVELLARASLGMYRVGLLQLGLEGTYMLTPRFGFGATYEFFTVDNGADPQYSAAGTLSSGSHGMAFVEGDLLRGVFTPYARLGVGVGRYDRYRPTTPGDSYGSPRTETDFVGQVALGGALRLGPVLARVSAAPTLYGKDAVMVYGVGLGARF